MVKNDQLMIEKIRMQYMTREKSEIEVLRDLDAKAKRPAYVFAYVFGVLSALIMGAGMSLVMTDVSSVLGIGGQSMLLGIIIGALGLVLAMINYPMHKSIMNSRKKKYASEILAMSEKIINN